MITASLCVTTLPVCSEKVSEVLYRHIPTGSYINHVSRTGDKGIALMEYQTHIRTDAPNEIYENLMDAYLKLGAPVTLRYDDGTASHFGNHFYVFSVRLEDYMGISPVTQRYDHTTDYVKAKEALSWITAYSPKIAKERLKNVIKRTTPGPWAGQTKLYRAYQLQQMEEILA